MKTLVVRFRSAIKAWKTGRSLNRCPTDPIGKCRAIEIDALAAHDLSLPIGQKMIVALRRQPGLDQSRRGRRLSNAVGTGAAGIFGTAGDDDAELRRNHIQPLRHVLTDAMQVSATDADQAFRLNDLLDPHEVARKGAAIGCRGLECCLLEGARHHLQLPSYATRWTRPGDRWHAYLGRETPHGEPCAGKTARDQLSAIGSFQLEEVVVTASVQQERRGRWTSRSGRLF